MALNESKLNHFKMCMKKVKDSIPMALAREVIRGRELSN